MVELNHFKIAALSNTRKSKFLPYPVVNIIIIYAVCSAIPSTNAVIYPQNRPSTIQAWEQLQSMPKRWFLPNGQDRSSTTNDSIIIWPEDRPEDYGIEHALNSVPSKTDPTKIILVWKEWSGSTVNRHLGSECLVNNCFITTNRSVAPYADAILFKYIFDVMPNHTRPPNQVWVMNIIEAPLYYKNFEFSHVFNWTSTYRRDSDLPMPYDYWYYYDKNIKFAPVAPNVAANKTKKVAWYVSNCNAANNRLEYARELSKYIEVDIYGKCGTKTCDRSSNKECYNMLKTTYKFYLSFENCICNEYVTEKLFFPLKYNILPITMGTTKEFYSTIAPENSFIHVDDFNSPKELADYLHHLDKNDDLYNSYFQFQGTGAFFAEHGFYPCRLCAALHSKFKERTVKDINTWRYTPGDCSFRPQGLGLPKYIPYRW